MKVFDRKNYLKKVQHFVAKSKSATYICTMEIKKALSTLITSPDFKEKAKEKNKDGGKLRMFLTRYQRGEVSTGSAVSLLEQFGYQVEIIDNKNK